MKDADALSYLEGRLNYEVRGMPERAELRIDRTALLLSYLGDPHRSYPIIHVAGTKGKGSTASMIASLCEEEYAKVGLHTSPHLTQVEERFRVNGRMISPATFTSFVEKLVPIVEEVDRALAPQPPLTFFEVTTALGLLYFAHSQVDIAVIEVGMGGRLDSTNVVDPAVSVITSISLDHTKQLGDTIPEIAWEKAGIIKPGRPVVCSVMDESARHVIHRRAAELGSPLKQLGMDFRFESEMLGIEGSSVDITTWSRSWPTLRIRPIGPHQCANGATACAVIDLIREMNGVALSRIDGSSLANLIIPGRFHVHRRRPTVVLDVAHNSASFEAMLSALRLITPAHHRGRRILLFSSSKDKDWIDMLSKSESFFREIYVTQYTRNSRAIPVETIRAQWKSNTARVEYFDDPRHAWDKACANVGITSDRHCWVEGEPGPNLGDDEDVVCIAGSFYLASEWLDGSFQSSDSLRC